MPETVSTFDVSPSVNNHFAWIRTQMGLQRTLMAAVRTAVSLIGFGFTVAQFFDKLVDKGGGADTLKRASPEIARNLGLVLIGAGALSLIAFTFQYNVSRRYLMSGEFKILAPTRVKSMHTSANMIAVVVTLIGLAAFVSVYMRF